MPVSLPSISLIYALLILVPGFLTYKTARRKGKWTAKVDRFDKAIYTVIGSGVSFSIITLVYVLVTGSQLGNVTGVQFPVYVLGVSYIGMLLVALVIGYSAGIVVDIVYHRDSDIRNEAVWELLAEGKEEPTKVRAVMNNGDEIWGEILVTDSEPHGQDILLRYPQKIARDEDDTEENTTSIGDYAFLSQSDISHIFFETDVDIQSTERTRNTGAWFYLKE